MNRKTAQEVDNLYEQLDTLGNARGDLGDGDDGEPAELNVGPNGPLDIPADRARALLDEIEARIRARLRELGFDPDKGK